MLEPLLVVGIIISAIVAFNELRFVGRTSLALVLIALAIVQAIYGVVLLQLVQKHES